MRTEGFAREAGMHVFYDSHITAVLSVEALGMEGAYRESPDGQDMIKPQILCEAGTSTNPPITHIHCRLGEHALHACAHILDRGWLYFAIGEYQ